jgi:hypothetical protein
MFRYSSRYESGLHSLLVAVPCIIGDRSVEVFALLDTAAEWCVLAAEVAEALGYSPAPTGGATLLSTRLGIFAGSLERVALRFPADFGEALSIDATWFVSPEWPGPSVIGWTGGLERVRFAVDPGEESFYFGEL